jgi:hypothetical protein
MKKCSQCKEIKDFDFFYYREEKKQYRAICKKCTRIKSKDYQSNHRDKKREIISDNKTFCKKCGENRKHVLHFHHTDPLEKKFTISNISDISITCLKNEISKCIVLCSNCHLDFHFLERTKNIIITDYLLKNES